MEIQFNPGSITMMIIIAGTYFLLMENTHTQKVFTDQQGVFHY